MIYYLQPDSLEFPDPHTAEPDGLIAIGGDLKPERLIAAYQRGIFPWFSYENEALPLWWCPQHRFVIFPREIHISHSMKQLLHSRQHQITFGSAFQEVVEACRTVGKRNEQMGAWLSPELKHSYQQLHESGYAQSVEVWKDDQLVGGLYGVTVGRLFCGESMFSRISNGSKLALIALAQKLAATGEYLIDCQFETQHLRTMGGRFISYDEYAEFFV